ncbi:ATP-binding cassette domain-containing protein [Bacillus nitratireducens]|uniref:ATP-binding cassette domain-containing protein n=1 Tax=Bacillus nitratireducens TaxID=2026193 RepID=UPI001BA906D5|nr:ATP-binding cassette domain-containing protein [Bacillus nitratireducens]QUG82679.1 ATP-binding cassette domain-containing protein [Bacillus nitratireducens]
MKNNYLYLHNVNKIIKNRTVLENINLTLERGKIYGFKGDNGSGKTMLFRMISGLILPTSGDVYIDNMKLHETISFPPSIGLLIEYPAFLPQYTGFKNLQILAKIKNIIKETEIKETLEKVGLDPNDKRKFSKYSLGMKQRLGLAQVLMEDPDLILLDEPTNALDSKGIEDIRKILEIEREKGKLILIASHAKEELQYLADEIFTIEKGKII